MFNIKPHDRIISMVYSHRNYYRITEPATWNYILSSRLANNLGFDSVQSVTIEVINPQLICPHTVKGEDVTLGWQHGFLEKTSSAGKRPTINWFWLTKRESLCFQTCQRFVNETTNRSIASALRPWRRMLPIDTATFKPSTPCAVATNHVGASPNFQYKISWAE